MPRKKSPSIPNPMRKLRQQAYTEAEAGDTRKLKSHGLKPIPESMKGSPTGDKAGRPRTGNRSARLSDDGTEIGSSHAHLDLAYNRFLEGIDEGELQTALSMVPADPKKKYRNALLMLTHPKYISGTRRDEKNKGKPGSWSLAAILKHAGITLPEMMEVYGRYRTSQAIRIAMDRTPTIMTHTADDAENKQVVCPRCDGLGTLDLDAAREETEKKRAKAVVRTCPECKGTGEVTQSGDMEARKLVFEVAGIAGKKGPVVDARQLHLTTPAGGFSVESLVKEMEVGEEREERLLGAPVMAAEEVIDVEEEEEEEEEEGEKGKL